MVQLLSSNYAILTCIVLVTMEISANWLCLSSNSWSAIATCKLHSSPNPCLWGTLLIGIVIWLPLHSDLSSHYVMYNIVDERIIPCEFAADCPTEFPCSWTLLMTSSTLSTSELWSSGSSWSTPEIIRKHLLFKTIPLPVCHTVLLVLSLHDISLTLHMPMYVQ